MDMNKEESVEYVTMTKLSYADIEPAVYETPYTPAGEARPSVRPSVSLPACRLQPPVLPLSFRPAGGDAPPQ